MQLLLKAIGNPYFILQDRKKKGEGTVICWVRVTICQGLAGGFGSIHVFKYVKLSSVMKTVFSI